MALDFKIKPGSASFKLKLIKVILHPRPTLCPHCRLKVLPVLPVRYVLSVLVPELEQVDLFVFVTLKAGQNHRAVRKRFILKVLRGSAGAERARPDAASDPGSR